MQLHIPSRSLGSPDVGRRHAGHAHFWDHTMTRGTFIRSTAGATGVALSSGLWMPALAHADNFGGVLPKPIPQTLDGSPFHVQLIAPGVEPSTITDFNGFIGGAEIQGNATDMLTREPLLFDADMRFMDGVYIGVDGRTHQGTFGFV
jgi:hypothetical protein